jgi:hypothetical protein
VNLLVFFKNNGHLRGLLYVSGAAATTLGAACADWANTPPRNWYVVGVVFFAMIGNVVLQLRGYLDQHLSKNPSTETVLASKEQEPILPPVKAGITLPTK